MNQDQLDQLTEQMNTFMEREGRKLFPPSKIDELRELGVKRCSTCTTVKNTTEFSTHSGKRDGLSGACKACDNAKAASYREDNPEKVAVARRNWEEDNPEYHREYYRDNRERINEYRHNRYYDPSDDYRLTLQLNSGHRRAIEAGNQAVRVTPEDLLNHWKSVGIDPWTCYLTGEPLDHLTRSVDHVIAIANGGSHTVENLAPCTAEANNKKQTTTAEEARELLSA